MSKSLAFLFLWCAMAVAHAQVTYTVTVENYSSIENFVPPCPGGHTCANYSLAMSQSGSFTVGAELAPNLFFEDISGSVESFSFSDGINEYGSSDPNVRVFSFVVSTDASGNMLGTVIRIQKWISGSQPHTAGDRFSSITIGSVSTNNDTCTQVGVSDANVQDSCILSVAFSFSDGESMAFASGEVWNIAAPVQSPQAIPTLSDWAMIFMAILMAIFGLRRMRRQ